MGRQYGKRMQAGGNTDGSEAVNVALSRAKGDVGYFITQPLVTAMQEAVKTINDQTYEFSKLDALHRQLDIAFHIVIAKKRKKLALTDLLITGAELHEVFGKNMPIEVATMLSNARLEKVRDVRQSINDYIDMLEDDPFFEAAP
jgi:hypothetical protein